MLRGLKDLGALCFFLLTDDDYSAALRRSAFSAI